jgi:hypothetical protein
MSVQRVYADFQNLDDCNRLRLTCAGTIADLKRQSIELREGLVLTFYMDDADDQGDPDELRTEGVVHYDEKDGSWVASVDWSALRHASEEEELHTSNSKPSDPGATYNNGPAIHRSAPPSTAAEIPR